MKRVGPDRAGTYVNLPDLLAMFDDVAGQMEATGDRRQLGTASLIRAVCAGMAAQAEGNA